MANGLVTMEINKKNKYGYQIGIIVHSDLVFAKFIYRYICVYDVMLW